ncbi:MAG: hypothetical protein JEZ00_01975 [Anaerolineaceae bacterium]|nr:hypothetical protein [Anaerolineaceae bacterium]
MQQNTTFKNQGVIHFLQSSIWPEYWNKQLNDRLRVHAENINNLLIIYETNIKDEIHAERKLGQNFV